MSLLSEVTITQFKKMSVEEIRGLQSFDVISDGVYLFTVVRPQNDYIKTQVEFLCASGNATGGKPPGELVEA